MTKDEALKLALDFVASISPTFICEATHHKKNERHAGNEPCPHVAKQKATYEAIKEALAQPEQEPVAWVDDYNACKCPDNEARCFSDKVFRMMQKHTTPPQRKPLTDEEIILIVAECAASHQHTDIHFARAIERAHGIKELV